MGTSRKVKNLHGQFNFRNVLWVDRNGGNHHHLPLNLLFISIPKNHQIWGSLIQSKKEEIDASARNYHFKFLKLLGPDEIKKNNFQYLKMSKRNHLQILQKISNGNCYGITVLLSSNQATFLSPQT